MEIICDQKNGDTLALTLDDIKKLPKVDITFNFKCIEGWNPGNTLGWRKIFRFLKAYGLSEESQMKYVGLVTPDEAYYVGIDMPSILHPQTILCYELDNQPLPMKEGIPVATNHPC